MGINYIDINYMGINYIESKPNTLIQLIEKYPNNDWNYQLLSSNPNITL